MIHPSKNGLFVMLITAVAVAGCKTAATPSVDQRLRNYFQITAEKREMTTDNVREALLAKVPVGTPEPQIYEFLKHSGIGEDRLSAFYPANDDRQIFCYVNSDPAMYQAFGSNKNKGYAITFILDMRDQLHDIRVQSWSPEDMVHPSQVPGVTIGQHPNSSPPSASGPPMPGSPMPDPHMPGLTNTANKAQ